MAICRWGGQSVQSRVDGCWLHGARDGKRAERTTRPEARHSRRGKRTHVNFGGERWLGMEDSNLRYLIQSQASYR